MKRVLYTITFLTVIVPSITFAQNAIGDINGVSIIALPETPRPNENVVLTLESTGVNLDSSTITWKVNGVQTISKVGERRFTTKTGVVGATLVVTVSVDTGTKIYQSTIQLNPSSVDILTEGKGYTPPFYKGRNLWTTQGSVTLIAFPHVVRGGKELSPTSLIYRWTKDGTVLGTNSGVGKNSLSFASSILSLPTDVTVEIMTDQNTVAASQSTSLNPLQPSILMFESSPLYGILFNRETGESVKVTKKEISFKAFPLFFTVFNDTTPDPVYSWSLNNETYSNPSSLITLRAPDNTTIASSNISLSITGQRKVTQGAKKELLVQYSQ